VPRIARCKFVSLRSTVAIGTLVVTALAVVMAGALVMLTSILDHTTAGAVESVESVRLAQESRVILLQYERAEVPLIQAEFEVALRSRLERAHDFVATDEEAAALAEAERHVTAYLELFHDPSHSEAALLDAHQGAYGALKQLTQINVDQAKAAQREASRWSSLADAIGVAAMVVLVLVSGGLLLWFRGRAFEPILQLAECMERFGRGDHEARAIERGALELREMCRHFNEMADAIAAQRHAQMAFLGGVAHDLRNPLSALQMSVVLLLANRSLCADAENRQAIERIGRQIKRLDRMVGDFLDGAKIEAGLLELRIEVYDARTIVEEVVELFEGLSAKHPLRVRTPDEALLICCDHLRLEQVLTNLISNAIKYSPAGGVVEIELRPHAGELELSVTDHGVGIPEEDRMALFEPFRRGGLSSEAVPGVGLGLYVVRKIVEAHHGRIEVESAPGRGSTFRVYLPLPSSA
jgi:two-component system sensor histidine kinase MtrB